MNKKIATEVPVSTDGSGCLSRLHAGGETPFDWRLFDKGNAGALLAVRKQQTRSDLTGRRPGQGNGTSQGIQNYLEILQIYILISYELRSCPVCIQARHYNDLSTYPLPSFLFWRYFMEMKTGNATEGVCS